MSRFVDKLQNLSKSSTTPIGFRHSVSEMKSPAMLLVARLSGTKVDEAKLVAGAKTSAGLIWDECPSAKIVGQMVKTLDEIPLGVFVKDISEKRINELVSSGCDFIVFDLSIAASILQKEEVGKFLMIGPSLDQGLVRSINNLDIDGVFMSTAGEGSFITMEQLLFCRRFVEILEKPLVMVLPSPVTKAEITALWQAGIVGLVVGSRQSVETLLELGTMINELSGRPRSRRAKAGVRLPHHGVAVSGEEDEEEEEGI